MKSTLDCLDCIVRQAVKAARIATDDPVVQRRIVNETTRRIPGMDLSVSPAALSMCAYEITSEITGNSDPYRELKREQNLMALALLPELREMVQTATDPLSAALHLAAAGNVIDLGTMQFHEVDDVAVRRAISQVMKERFAVDHSDVFRASLTRCNDLLYLLDNAGEIVFDMVLIEELLKHTSVTAVVKGAPILNDVLLEDAEMVGLTEICPVIDNGGAFIGAPLDQVPESFLNRMHQADIIVGKGQGNFETVDEFPGDVYLILRAKCEVVAKVMGVQYGQVGLISMAERRRNLVQFR